MRIPAKKLLPALLVVAVAGAGYLGWRLLGDHGPGEGFISGNGRIEATEIDVAAKLPGRVQDVLVKEGDFVAAGQPLARMQVDTLLAQRAEAVAQQQRAINGVASAAAQTAQRESDKLAAQAVVAQRERAGRRAPAPGALRNLVARRRLVDPGTGRRPRPRAQRPGRRACRARPGDGRGRRHRGRARRPGGRAIGGRGGAGHGRAHRRRPGRQRAARAAPPAACSIAWRNRAKCWARAARCSTWSTWPTST